MDTSKINDQYISWLSGKDVKFPFLKQKPEMTEVKMLNKRQCDDCKNEAQFGMLYCANCENFRKKHENNLD